MQGREDRVGECSRCRGRRTGGVMQEVEGREGRGGACSRCNEMEGREGHAVSAIGGRAGGGHAVRAGERGGWPEGGHAVGAG